MNLITFRVIVEEGCSTRHLLCEIEPCTAVRRLLSCELRAKELRLLVRHRFRDLSVHEHIEGIFRLAGERVLTYKCMVVLEAQPLGKLGDTPGLLIVEVTCESQVW